MTLTYVAPKKMEEYQKQLLLFAKGAPSLKVIGAHYLPEEETGHCDLSDTDGNTELFVLANRSGQTMKVARGYLDIVANLIELESTAEAYESLKQLKKRHREKLELAARKLEEARSRSSRVVLRRKRS